MPKSSFKEESQTQHPIVLDSFKQMCAQMLQENLSYSVRNKETRKLPDNSLHHTVPGGFKMMIVLLVSPLFS